jgi:hypothetical protein
MIKSFHIVVVIIKDLILYKYIINLSLINFDCLVMISEINLIFDEHFEMS